jgi:hypothetical protein
MLDIGWCRKANLYFLAKSWTLDVFLERPPIFAVICWIFQRKVDPQLSYIACSDKEKEKDFSTAAQPDISDVC